MHGIIWSACVSLDVVCACVFGCVSMHHDCLCMCVCVFVPAHTMWAWVCACFCGQIHFKYKSSYRIVSFRSTDRLPRMWYAFYSSSFSLYVRRFSYNISSFSAMSPSSSSSSSFSSLLSSYELRSSILGKTSWQRCGRQICSLVDASNYIHKYTIKMDVLLRNEAITSFNIAKRKTIARCRMQNVSEKKRSGTKHFFICLKVRETSRERGERERKSSRVRTTQCSKRTKCERRANAREKRKKKYVGIFDGNEQLVVVFCANNHYFFLVLRRNSPALYNISNVKRFHLHHYDNSKDEINHLQLTIHLFSHMMPDHWNYGRMLRSMSPIQTNLFKFVRLQRGYKSSKAIPALTKVSLKEIQWIY